MVRREIAFREEPGALLKVAPLTTGKRVMRSEHSALSAAHALMRYAAALFITCTAQADEFVDLKIPPQPLETALLEFSDQTGAQEATSSASIADLTAKGASGRLTPRMALAQLIEGSNLVIQSSGERSYSLVATPPQTSRKVTSIAESAPPVSSESGDPKKQERPADASSTNSGEQSHWIETVLVTAQKRVERLIDTPQSVTVMSSDALAKLSALQFRDFANTVPGLTFATAGAGNNQIAIRGVTTGITNNPTVGIYVDEVPYGSSSAFGFGARLALDVGLFDVDRIEVLRGPQGTLYGASTMGGLLKYVSKQPDASSSRVDVQVGMSSTENGDVNYSGSAALNAPIVTDKAAVRGSAFFSRDGGYINNVARGESDVNGSDVYGGRVDLLFTPTDALSIRLGGFLQNISRDGQASVDYTLAGVPIYGSLDQYRPAAEPFSQQFRLGSATVVYEFGPTTLTSISSYQTVTSQIDTDISAQFVPLLARLGFGAFTAVVVSPEYDTDKFTQEVRLASSSTESVEWLIGGFYTREKSLYEEVIATAPTTRTDLETLSRPTVYEEYAAFGDLTYRFTSKFDVTAGIRYSQNDQTYTTNGSGVFVTPQPTQRSEEDVVTYLANARYHFADHATGYLRYATGYRPGGPNFAGNDPATGLRRQPLTFESDKLKSYEVGYKVETIDRRFGADIAGYYIDWTNIQALTNLSGFGIVVNAPGGATIQGAELTLTARPTRDFAITGAFAYQDAQLSEDAPLLRAVKGERLPNVPRFTAALSADYDFASDVLRPTVGATLRHASDRTAIFNGPIQYRMPEYTTVDLRAGITLGSVDVQMYCRNLFDERGELSAFNRLVEQVSIMQPRTVGLTATTQF